MDLDSNNSRNFQPCPCHAKVPVATLLSHSEDLPSNHWHFASCRESTRPCLTPPDSNYRGTCGTATSIFTQDFPPPLESDRSDRSPKRRRYNTNMPSSEHNWAMKWY
eukprot:NODE_5755_length_554_cov_39.891089_g5016_i0.p1 GENE.NODE_5755_length_554_cov_39.891089_g5016_i0~~NODE_5755_length_554_cov_39.891089_g5016_i0.p1  ORF type:complete len:121 (-),score=27.69 NODE_5755_length_554_cov_39.891089_g5016_i0:190-510(-)